MRKPLIIATTIGLAAAPFALAAPTQAIAPSAATTIYACQKKKSGALRVVKKSKKCKKSEKKISWNTAGPKGDKGDKGDTGAPGAPGPGATPFSAQLVTVNMLASSVSQDVPVGDMTLNIQCGVFVGALGSSARITSPTAGSYVTRGSWLNNPTDDDGGYNAAPLIEAKAGDLVANTQATMTAQGVQVSMTGSSPVKNTGVLSFQVTNAGGKYLITYAATTAGQENPPTASPKGYCDITGWWSKLS